MAARLHRMAELRRYFDSWNARDPTGVLAAFALGGTYSDPTGTTPPWRSTCGPFSSRFRI
jgi:hypothetical protein